MGKFFEVSKANLNDNKNVVVSLNNTGMFSVAQQMMVEDNGKQIPMFIKNSIITDVDGLRRLHQAIGEAIEKVENGQLDISQHIESVAEGNRY